MFAASVRPLAILPYSSSRNIASRNIEGYLTLLVRTVYYIYNKPSKECNSSEYVMIVQSLMKSVPLTDSSVEHDEAHPIDLKNLLLWHT